MRTIFILIFVVALFACNRPPETGFVKIYNFERDSLISQIKPNQDYIYWEYRWTDFFLQDKIIRTVGDSTIKSQINIVNPENGFFHECEPGFCYSYIIYVDSTKVKYITNEKELRNFIGKIDNLEEAILISKTYGLWFDTEDLDGGSYKKVNNGFELYLMKWEPCPESKESVKVFIDSLGNFKSQSKGIYYKSKDCTMT